MARRTLLLLLSMLLSVAIVAPVAAAPTFTDVPDSNIFSDHIEWLATMAITEGCNPPVNDHYCPNNYVTRGQMAAFLVRGLGLTDAGGGDHFDDDNGSVFEDSIDKLYTAGITSGCNPPANNNYCPNNYVTRGQMAAFLVRGLGLSKTIYHDRFDDDNNSIFEDSIDKLYTAGITSGCNPPANNNYCPNNYVTREQMAAFLRRGLDDPPTKVTGVFATTSGGSAEISVYWDALPDPDIDHYDVLYSYAPGDTKILITDPWQGPQPLPGNRWEIVDYPYSLTSGFDCFQVRGVDMAGQQGALSAEACFDSTPGAPSQVTGVIATTSGGSGEIAVYWDEVPEFDVIDYNVWYSEFPGGTKTQLTDPTFGPEPTTGDRWYIIDFPYSLVVGRHCFEISAVDLSGNEGPRSSEGCFAP